jgi:hypothetical protein
MERIAFLLINLLLSQFIWSQELVILTSATSKNEVIVDFNKQLPTIEERLKKENISCKVIDTDSLSVPVGVSSLPSLYVMTKKGPQWYKGRYKTLDRLVSFVKNSPRFDFQPEFQELSNVFVSTSSGFDKITRLKVTDIKYEEGYEGKKKSHLINDLINSINQPFYESYLSKEQFKIYYLDVYPYIDKKGQWFLSTKIFSQHNCQDPIVISKQPFSGTREEVIKKIALWYKKELNTAYNDTDRGDGLLLNLSKQPTTWNKLGYPTNYTKLNIDSTFISPFHFKVNTKIDDPIRFSFAPPLDNYNGSFKQIKGDVSYIDSVFRGRIVLNISSIDMGGESISASVFNQLLGETHHTATFTFEEKTTLSSLLNTTKGRMNFLGQEFEQVIHYQLEKQTDSTLTVNANLLLNINPFSSLEKPIGKAPLNNVVHISVKIFLQKSEMEWGKNTIESKTEVVKNQRIPTDSLKGDWRLEEGSIAFVTEKYNVTGSTKKFQAMLNVDGSFKAIVNLNTLTFKKGKLMQKHALGDQGLQVSVFPFATLSGIIEIDFNKQSQTIYCDANLKIHDATKVVRIKLVVKKEDNLLRIKTTVPVDRNIHSLNGKKANSIDDIVLVTVDLLMKK